MPTDLKTELLEYAGIFKHAGETGINETDTFMYMQKMYGYVFGFNCVAGEISKELWVKNRIWDFCVKLNSEIQYLVDIRSASYPLTGVSDLKEISEVAVREEIRWILLTNGQLWKFYALTGTPPNNSAPVLLFDVNLSQDDPDKILKEWETLKSISKAGILELPFSKRYEQYLH